MAWFPLGVTAAPEDASTTAWVNAVVAASGTVSSTQRSRVDTLIKAYKAAGVWNLLDHEWLFAAENVKCAQIDIKGLASHTPVSLGHFPVFVANRGYELFSDDGYIDLGFAPSSGVNFQQNTASFGIYILLDRTFPYAFSSMGTTDNTSFSFMRPFNTAGIEYDVNSSSFNTVANTTTKGNYLFSRINSTTVQPYRNDVALPTGTTAPAAARASYNWYLFAYDGAGAVPGVIADDQIASCFTGGALNGTQALAKNAALNAYMLSVGCAVYGGPGPVNTVLPVITGTATVGQTLSANTGTWTGAPTITYAYQWRRAVTDIPGQTASSYTLAAGDLALNIAVTVTATNGSGSTSATAMATAPVAAAGTFDESKRSTINVNSLQDFSYHTIDHFKQGDNWLSPTSDGSTAGWVTPGHYLPQNVDADGYPNKDDSGGTSSTSYQPMGGGIRIPSCTSFNGPYVLEWNGNGTVVFNVGTVNLVWTQDNTTALGDTTNTYTRAGNAFTNKPGQNARVVIKPSGTNFPTIFRPYIGSNGPAPFLTALRFYRYEDRADLLAGKIFRTGWKQNIVNLNPRHIRLLDWSGANSSNVVRFEHRNKPSYASQHTQNYAACGQPQYGATSMPSSYQYTLASATGMPVSYQHGEQVTCFIPAAQFGSAQACPIMYLTAITNNVSDATVTVDLAQGYMTNAATFSWSGGVATVTLSTNAYTVGTTIQAVIAGASPAGYNNTNATCTVTAATLFTNTITYPLVTNPGGASSTGTFASHGRPNGEKVVLRMSGTANNEAPQGMVQIDRRVATVTNVTPSTFTTGLATTGYTAFTVGHAVNNMTLDVGGRGARPVVRQDGNSPVLMYYGKFFNQLSNGTYCTFTMDKMVTGNTGVAGTWLVDQSPGVLSGPIAPEIATALVNELMAMSPLNPINLYICMPTLGMTSADPDYTAASNWAVNYLDIIVNPASSQRAAGFSVLDSRCKVYVEHSNETWNFGASFVACYYQAWRGHLLFGGGLDTGTYSSIRAVQMVRDCKAAFPPASWPQIKYVLGLFSTFGDLVYNVDRFYGNANYNSVISGGHTPMYEFDHAAFAGYFANDDAFPAQSLATNLAAWQAAIPNQAGMDAAYSNYIQGFKTYANNRESIDSYVQDKLGGVHGAATAAVAQGKSVIGYEGGWQVDVTNQAHVFYDTYGNFTNGSPAATGFASGIAYPVGNYVIGPGIPAFAKVLGSPAPTGGTFTMSANFTGTTGQSYFVCLSPTAYFWALSRASSFWATVHKTWFDNATAISGSYAPAEFVIQNVGNLAWSHTFWRDSYIGTDESAGFDLDFIAQGNRNRGL